jgi:putative toxin-antitoxin system antitoxin component (TIGR02293 family)
MSPAETPVEILLNRRTKTDGRLPIYELSEEGFALENVIRFVASVGLFKDKQVLANIIGMSARTLQRRLKHPGERLTPEQSVRALRFAEVLTNAQDILGGREEAERWMIEPSIWLDGHTPINLLTNPADYELLANFMTRMEYGVYQ